MISEDYQQRRSSRASLPTCHHRGTYCQPTWVEAPIRLGGLSAFLFSVVRGHCPCRFTMRLKFPMVMVQYLPTPSHFISIERAQTSCRMCVCVFANSIEVSLYLVPNSGGTGKRLVRRPHPPPTSAPLPDDFDAITVTRDGTTIYDDATNSALGIDYDAMTVAAPVTHERPLPIHAHVPPHAAH